jgi:hypothetical protein
MTLTEPIPTAVHVGADELPFVEIGGGSKLKVLQVKEREGLWIVQNLFQAGYEVQKHRHTGPVWGYTVSGAWKYKEYDYVNRAGSFLYEDADGNVESVTDGAGTLNAYYMLCEAEGFPRPNVLVD